MEKKEKTYVLKKKCPSIGKEIGDYYNNEFGESIEELLKKGIIEEERRKGINVEDLIFKL